MLDVSHRVKVLSLVHRLPKGFELVKAAERLGYQSD
jgi:hypothetical protein